MPTLLEEKTRQLKRRGVVIICCLIALFVGIVPAYAGIGDILMSIFGWIISTICQFVLGILETIAATFLTAMSIDYDELQQMRILDAFNNFAPVIQVLATTIAGVVLLWQLLTSLFGPYLGTKQNASTGNIVARALIFIPLTFVIQPLAEGALRMFQDVYTDLLNGWYDLSNGQSVPMVSEKFNDAFGGFGNFFSSVGAPVSGVLDSNLAEIASILVSCVLLILIVWNFLKFLLEMTQRFVVMIVYIYLSPLAVACGVSPNSIEIAKKGLTLFLSSGVLWLLNVWCVGIAISLFNSIDYATGSATNFLVWALITYGFLKIIQQLDDIFNAVGATNVKLSGSVLDELFGLKNTLGSIPDSFRKLSGKLDNFAENGFFSGKGSSPSNPVTPNVTTRTRKMPIGDAVVKGATQAAAGISSVVKGETSPAVATQMLKHGAKTAVGGVAGAVTGNRIAQGVRKTGENIKTRVGGAVSEAHTMQDNLMKASMNGALSRSTSQERAEAMKNLAADQPQVLNSDAVKAHIGEAMGLADNQKVTSLSVDENGNLSATVATAGATGVTMSKVTGLNDMNTGVPAQGSKAQPGSATFSASQVFDTNRNVATATYTGTDGKTHRAEVTRTRGESLDGKTAMFTVISDDGRDSAFNAPANMTAEEVGAVFTGSASAETMAKYEAGRDAADPKQSMDGAYNTLGVDTSVSGSSVVGTPVENSPDSKFTVGGITMARTDIGGMNQGKDVWTGYDANGNSVGTVEAPQGITARQMADMVVNGGNDKGGIREFTENAGIVGYGNSDVSFESPSAPIADAGSPDTKFSVGGVTMARTKSGSNGGDTWTGYDAQGNSVGSVTVPQGASAQQVADMVIHSHDNDSSGAREFAQSTGISAINNPDITFASNPEAQNISFAGEHDNGTNWGPEFKMSFQGTGENASPDFRYSYQNEAGETVVARAIVSRLDELEMPPLDGKVGYMYTNNHGDSGRIYLDAKITTEQLAAALATENGGGIEGVEEIRKELGIRESYSTNEGKQFREALELARRTKKGPLNSADSPIGKSKK